MGKSQNFLIWLYEGVKLAYIYMLGFLQLVFAACCLLAHAFDHCLPYLEVFRAYFFPSESELVRFKPIYQIRLFFLDKILFYVIINKSLQIR